VTFSYGSRSVCRAREAEMIALLCKREECMVLHTIGRVGLGYGGAKSRAWRLRLSVSRGGGG